MRNSEVFNPSDADVVLLTSDGVQLGVYRRILVEASVFFRDMFSLPQGDPSLKSQSTEAESIPVIEISEPASVMEDLLLLIYPGSDPSVPSLDVLSALLAAATKYELTRAIATLRRLLLAPAFVEKEPARVYAIACRHDLTPEARAASTYTLRTNVLDAPLSDDLKHITAWSYHKLLDLHRRRGAAALRVLDTASTSGALEGVKCMQCSAAHYGGLSPPRWWTEFVGRAREELKSRPTTDVVFSMVFLAESGRTGCQRCVGSILESHAFLEGLKRQIDELPSTI